MKAVAYIRVSQDDERPENQKIRIEEYASTKSIHIDKYFVDIGTSGASEVFSRPKFQQLLSYARKHRINTIVFYDLSRLSRNVEDGLLTLKKLTDEGFILLFAENDFLGSIYDPMLRKKVIMDFLWFAELYREDIRKRTIQGLRRARAEGKRIGRPPAPCRAIINLRKSGLSYSEIQEELGVSKATVWRCLKKFQNQF